MNTRLLIFFLLIGCCNSWAQDSLVTIKPGNKIRDVLPMTEILYSPEFITSKVFFRDGVVAAAKMNYNSVDDQMLFINPKGDTMVLANEKTVDFITMGKDTFFYADGYVRLVHGNGTVKLAEKKAWKVADIRKIGSHNRPVSGYAVTSLRTMTDGQGRTYELVLDEELLLRRTTTYYFGDMYNKFFLISRKHLLAAFPKKENILTGYLKDNDINLGKRPDLEKLAQFLDEH